MIPPEEISQLPLNSRARVCFPDMPLRKGAWTHPAGRSCTIPLITALTRISRVLRSGCPRWTSARAARQAGGTARVHLKVDSGLGRNGCPVRDWPQLVGAALRAQADKPIRVVGLWSHLAMADIPGHPSVAAQAAAFSWVVQHAEQAGVRSEVRHLANSAATLLLPETRLDLARAGLAAYGLSPAPQEGSGTTASPPPRTGRERQERSPTRCHQDQQQRPPDLHGPDPGLSLSTAPRSSR